MIRVLVIANDSLLVDAIASILAVEIGPDVLQLIYRLPGSIFEVVRNHRSVLILVDEGATENSSIKVPDSIRDEGPALVIKASLKTMDIDIHKSYPLTRPGMEQAIELVRDFIRTYFKKKAEDVKMSFLIPSPFKT
jgi:hypothetical protein